MNRRVVIALGANLGTPARQLDAAWTEVCTALQLQHPLLSSIFRSAPAEGASGPDFANAVGLGYTTAGATETLAVLHAIERRFGRDREREGHHGSRPLDLDLIDWGGAIMQQEGLELPHPRAHRRAFVLRPLAELCADWRHPRLGVTPNDLLADLPPADRASVLPW
ncbi:MAG: 2-amino-4-hydroxy-6-hydroxymethyldihydropteridine diphosphokinase [Deltaproteobacteria bacterium]|nr:2-amino-4-hydroxy-6-hydroxymethyldihydropteridine diphosphokinase [Deltaproteobacteria bacterium]